MQLFLIKKKNVKAKIPRQIKNINNIFSDSDALTALIIKYCYQFLIIQT